MADQDENGRGSRDELPQDVVDEAVRLTRLARRAVDENERAACRREREALLDDHGFASRIREEDDVLVLHPGEWVRDGVVRVEDVDDVDRAVEVPLSGAGEDDDWAAVEEHNAALVERVRDRADERHAANARAFADFMGNHYARRIETASREEIREFLSEYYPRNAWPSEGQQAVIAESLELLFEAADADVPAIAGRR